MTSAENVPHASMRGMYNVEHWLWELQLPIVVVALVRRDGLSFDD